MLSAKELLLLLEERGVSQADIARVIKLPSSRVTEMYNLAKDRPGPRRRLQLDEAKKLVESFGLDERANPLSKPIARLLVLHAASALDLDLDPSDRRVEDLALDFRAFSQFASDPQVRESEQAVRAFFQGLRLAPGRTAGAPA